MFQILICTTRYNCIPAISADPDIKKAVQASVEVVDGKLSQGQAIYGVNTGVGASAGTRTGAVRSLQKSLVQMHHCGILTSANRGVARNFRPLRELESHALPLEVVRGMMLIRANSLLRGHSAVRLETIEAILALLAKNITPVVPLRGSVSASGDLNPLSYLCGALEGNPDIYVHVGISPEEKVLTADVALEQAGLKSVSFEPKEALGLLNGTATSCSAASFAIFQARQLIILALLLTAMGTEALQGSRQSHHPFVASIRPHPGQSEVAAKIFAFLADSALVADRETKQAGTLQDRYPLRTTSQWVGPQLEDLALAAQQVQIELNSTTDNPLVDTLDDLIHYGGNFQAVALTSAMDKTLSATQMLGRLVFAQCSELLNAKMNKGLPPNLCADDPSLSMTFKGVDINMSAYMSELAHISHSVGPYVQSAEEHNEAVNSLALLAARNTLKAIDILSMMCSAYLYALCQALDLRCLQLEFFKAAERKSLELFREFYREAIGDSKNTETVHSFPIWPRIKDKWLSFASLDLVKRADATAAEVTSTLLEETYAFPANKDERTGYRLYVSVQSYKRSLSDLLIKEYRAAHEAFLTEESTPRYLGSASRVMYGYVREELRVPLHTGFREHPTVTAEEIDEDLPHEKKTIGTRISHIYEALQSGMLYRPLMEIVDDLGEWHR